jgi:hypothetical protein
MEMEMEMGVGAVLGQEARRLGTLPSGPAMVEVVVEAWRLAALGEQQRETAQRVSARGFGYA